MRNRALPIIALVALVECVPSRSTPPTRPAPSDVFRDSFDDPAVIQVNWIAGTPSIVGASAQLEDSAIRLTMPPNSEGDVAFRHRLDVSSLRGKRVRVRARTRTDAARESFAWATVVVTPAQGTPSDADRVGTRAVNAATWVDVRTVLDVDPIAVTAELSLVLHGPGSAWFDDVAIEIVGDSPGRAAAQLSRQQLDNVMTFARAAR